MTGNGGVKEEPRLIAAMLVRAEQRIARHRSRPRRAHQPGQMDEGTATFDQRNRIRVDGLDAVEPIFGIPEEPPWRTRLTNLLRAITRTAPQRCRVRQLPRLSPPSRQRTTDTPLATSARHSARQGTKE